VTLNFAPAERAVRAVRFARILSALSRDPIPVAHSRSLSVEADLAFRIEKAPAALADATPQLIDAADELSERLRSLEHELDRLGIGFEDVRISTHWRNGARFLLREGPIFLLAMVALPLGWATHWIPLRMARVLALRSLR